VSHLAQDPVKRKLRRDWYWPTIQSRSQRGLVLTLPSSHCADLMDLERILRVSRKFIVCVDYDNTVLRRVERKFLGAQYVVGDVFQIVPRLSRPFAVLDLDLCCTMTERVAMGLIDIMTSQAVASGTIIGLTLCLRSAIGLSAEDTVYIVRQSLRGTKLLGVKRYRNSVKYSPMLNMILEVI
jgi:hypothetical protein